jgi:hypothetical protein
MKLITSLAVALIAAACATAPYDAREIEAVRDFIVSAELKPVDKVRIYGQMNYTYINDRFVTIPTRRGDYLAEFNRDCRDLRSSEFTADMIDVRDSDHYVRARFDTIRGCTISKIYEITDEQRKEIKALGDAPGDEVFIPERDESDEGA